MATRAQAKYDLIAEDRSAAGFTSFKNRLTSAGAAVARFGIIAAGAAIGGIAAFGGKALQAVDKIAKMSDALGVSTEFLGEMRFVASQAGTSVDAIGKSMSRMTRNINDGARGLKTQARSFESIGLNAASLARLSPEQAFMKIGFALNSMTDATKRAAAAQEIFGRGGLQMLNLFKGGPEQFQMMRDEAKNMGLSLSREAAAGAEAANDAFDKLRTSFEGIIEVMTLQFAPGIAELITSLQQHVVPVLSKIIGGIASTLGTVGRTAGGIAAAGVQAGQGNFGESFSILKQVFSDLFSDDEQRAGPEGEGKEQVEVLREIAKNTAGQLVAVAG